MGKTRGPLCFASDIDILKKLKQKSAANNCFLSLLLRYSRFSSPIFLETQLLRTLFFYDLFLNNRFTIDI